MDTDFSRLAESLPQIVWIADTDGKNVYFNQKWVDYTGLSLEESCGDGWNQPSHPDDRQLAWNAWQNAVTKNEIYSLVNGGKISRHWGGVKPGELGADFVARSTASFRIGCMLVMAGRSGMRNRTPSF
ncbi:MAG: PAS domain-containing protein [Rhodoplanes sp.]